MCFRVEDKAIERNDFFVCEEKEEIFESASESVEVESLGGDVRLGKEKTRHLILL